MLRERHDIQSEFFVTEKLVVKWTALHADMFGILDLLAHKHINTHRSSLSLTSLISSVSVRFSWPATTVLLLDVVPDQRRNTVNHPSHKKMVEFKRNVKVEKKIQNLASSYPSVRWRLCCWRQSGRTEGCHSATPQGWPGQSAVAQTGAPPSSGWCCCDTGR